MIDPLETALQHLRASSTLTNFTADRIAAQHRYGADVAPWDVSLPGLTLQYTGGGEADTATADPMHRVELTCRMYGDSYVDCAETWRRVLLVCRDTQRATVQTGAGRALLYWLIPRANPRADVDPETGILLFETTLESAVSQTALD